MFFAEPSETPDAWSETMVLSEVLHRVGHDIGNPLTAIISLASIMEFTSAADGLPGLPREKLNEYAASIMSEAWKVSHIVERMVMMFSDRLGNVAPCSVGEIAERVMQRLKSRHHIQDLRVESDFFFAPSAARVLADSDQLFLLISELLLNAYTFQGPPDGTEAGRLVLCSLGAENGFVHLQFRNRIPALHEGNLADLFRPLQCGLEKSTTQKGLRTGLGLSAVLAIVIRHGGKIALEQVSTESGNEFTVHIHLPSAEESAASEEDSAEG